MAVTARGPGDDKGAMGVRGVDNAVIGSTREVVGKKVRVGLFRAAVILGSPLAALAEAFVDAEIVVPDDVVEDIEEEELLR